MSDYPRMIYRKSDEGQELHGLRCDTHVVDCAEEANAYLDQGWALTPAEAHGKEPVRPAPADRREGQDGIEGLRQELDSLRAENEQLKRENAELRGQIARFDHDGNGVIGGSAEQPRRGPGRPPRQQAS